MGETAALPFGIEYSCFMLPAKSLFKGDKPFSSMTPSKIFNISLGTSASTYIIVVVLPPI